MNKASKSIILVAFILIITVLLPTFMDSIDLFGNRADADVADWTETDLGDGGSPSQPITGSDTFLVLEIAPYKGMGEIGYLVGGEEPVDEELFDRFNVNGNLSFLGGSITPYESYVEKPLPSSGEPDNNWTRTKICYSQNGYFQYVGASKGTHQKLTNQKVYRRVTSGQGSYKAKLLTEDVDIYNKTGDKLNKKNVKAYFVYGKPEGVALYSQTNVYIPSSVTRSKNHTGDYDYNSETGTFLLNKGKGLYDVLFSRNVSGSKYYYMTADYEIVNDSTGDYSWNIDYDYVGETGGNYEMKTDGTVFQNNSGDKNLNAYKWVEAEMSADKANFYQEGTPGTSSERIWVRGQTIEKNMEYNFNVTLVNNEWFKRYTLGLSGLECITKKVEVVTMTPTELNLPENQHYLSEANMFYINDKYDHNTSYYKLYESKSYEGLALPASQKFDSIKDSLNFGVKDLTWASTMKVFNRVAGVKADGSLGGYRAAVVFDHTFYNNAIQGSGGYSPYKENVTVGFSWNSNGATICNLAKLYIMLCQRDPAKFYQAFLSPSSPRRITEVTSSRSKTGSTGSFVRPDSTAAAGSIEATFWNGNTFCAYILNDTGNLISLNINNDEQKLIIQKEIPNFNITAQTTDMIANILVLNGQDIFTSKFIEPLNNMPDDAKEEARRYAALMNGGTFPSDVGIFGYISVVTQSGDGYGGGGSGSDPSEDGENGGGGSNLRTYLSILNIQPTADFIQSENEIREIFSFRNIRIINMTSAEFNSSILDINTHFDVIFIGGNIGRYNSMLVTENGKVTKDKYGNDLRTTLYNDSSLAGSVYHKGDTAIITGGTEKYIGNDITAQKMAELSEFIQAGYPIVLDDNLYTLSSAVKSNTNLYRFIQTTKGTTPPENLLNMDEYKSTDSNNKTKMTNKDNFLVKLIKHIAIPRPMIRMLSPILPKDSDLNYFYVDPVSKKLEIQFAILPQDGTVNPSRRYNAYLYMDFNEDGIFAPSEKLDVVTEEGFSCNNKEEALNRFYTYSFDMSKYNGVFQWQVKVVRQSFDAQGVSHDTPIRSEITGYAAFSNKQPIKILQIIDNTDSDTSACSLEERVKVASSLIRKYGGFGTEKLEDYEISFDTMTVEEFLALYQEKPYPGTDANTTNRLAGYHLLIMDNQKDGISDTNGALANIKSEITKGIGVIFTKGAINASNQTAYLGSDNLLFENRRTYPLLSNNTVLNGNPYYIFDFLNYGFTRTMLHNLATYDTSYITKSNEGADSQYPYKIGEAIKITSSSYASDATIDYNRSSSLPLIGWYSLSDDRSPVVRANCTVSDKTPKVYTGIYSSSPNDVKNNYYLFNRGKIYYSGIQLGTADTMNNDSEIKLFINTIIATYKTSGRTLLAKTPVITMLNPVPEEETILLDRNEIETRTEAAFTFEVSESSSDMKIMLLWNYLVDSTVAWKLYQVDDKDHETEVEDRNTITNGTYRVYIPTTALKEREGNNKLTIIVKNEEDRSKTLHTTIQLKEPMAVKLDNINLIKRVDKEEQYLYIDINYVDIDNSEIANGDGYLSSNTIKLEFSIANAPGNVNISVIDLDHKDSDGKVINENIVDKIYSKDDDTEFMLTDKIDPSKKYYLLLPAEVMKQIASKDIKVTAEYSTAGSNKVSASTTVTLLRRSLFQLD